MDTYIYECWKNTFRGLVDTLLPYYSKFPEKYTDEDKEELADRMVEYFFDDEELDNMKIRHAKYAIKEMDEEFEECLDE